MTQEQEHNGGKNDKKDQKIIPFLSLMLNPMLHAIAILELILWHKYENREKSRKKDILPLTKPL